jgi:hypothetical protein
VPTSLAFHKFGERKTLNKISDPQTSKAKQKPVTKKSWAAVSQLLAKTFSPQDRLNFNHVWHQQLLVRQ